MNRRSGNAFQQAELPEPEREYRHRQIRRRIQASGLIGIIGIALFLGDTLIVWFDYPIVTVSYWGLVAIITLLVAFLAMADFWATRRYLNRVYEDSLLEQTRLHAELYRLQQEKTQERLSGNGDA